MLQALSAVAKDGILGREGGETDLDESVMLDNMAYGNSTSILIPIFYRHILQKALQDILDPINITLFISLTLVG